MADQPQEWLFLISSFLIISWIALFLTLFYSPYLVFILVRVLFHVLFSHYYISKCCFCPYPCFVVALRYQQNSQQIQSLASCCSSFHWLILWATVHKRNQYKLRLIDEPLLPSIAQRLGCHDQEEVAEKISRSLDSLRTDNIHTAHSHIATSCWVADWSQLHCQWWCRNSQDMQ